MNLQEGMIERLNNARELLRQYEAIPTGIFGAAVIRDTIRRGEQALGSGDVIEILKSYEELGQLK